jgi:hypothetical protein
VNNPRVIDRVHFDSAMPPTAALAVATPTRYFNLKKSARRLFAWQVGAMAAAATSTGVILEATDHLGTGAAPIAAITDAITANTDVTAATLTAAACAPGDTFVLNGVEFTGAAAQSIPDLEFEADAADDAVTAASIVAVINGAVALGLIDGVFASDNGVDTVTIRALEPGENNITLVGTAVKLIAATVEAWGYLEVRGDQLTDGCTHVALQITPSAAQDTAAFTATIDERYPLDQPSAAGN